MKKTTKIFIIIGISVLICAITATILIIILTKPDTGPDNPEPFVLGNFKQITVSNGTEIFIINEDNEAFPDINNILMSVLDINARGDSTDIKLVCNDAIVNGQKNGFDGEIISTENPGDKWIEIDLEGGTYEKMFFVLRNNTNPDKYTIDAYCARNEGTYNGGGIELYSANINALLTFIESL